MTALELSGGQFTLIFFVTIMTFGVLAYLSLRRHVRKIDVPEEGVQIKDDTTQGRAGERARR